MPLMSTKGRLAPSIKIRAITHNNQGKELPGKVIGAIQRLAKTETRTVTKLRGLGFFAFTPYTIVPGPINISLNMKRTVLYDSEIMRAVFGSEVKISQNPEQTESNTEATEKREDISIPTHTIFYQRQPFIIELVMYTPYGKREVVDFYDCWFISNPIAYDVSTDDLLVVQDASIEVGRVEPGDGGIPYHFAGLFKKVFPKAGIKL